MGVGSKSWVSPTVESRTLKRDRDKALAIRKVSPPFKSVVTDGTQALPKSTSCTKANVSQMKPAANTMCGQKGQYFRQKSFTNTLCEQKWFTKQIMRTKRFEGWTKEVLENNTELTANRSPSITIETIGLV